jgi:hypothetical protein
MKKEARAEKKSNICIRLGAVFGLLAQVGAFAGFVALCFFAKAVPAG